MNRTDIRLTVALLLAAQTAAAASRSIGAAKAAPGGFGLKTLATSIPGVPAKAGLPTLTPAPRIIMPVSASAGLPASALPTGAPAAPAAPQSVGERVSQAALRLEAAAGGGQIDKGPASAHAAGQGAEAALTGERMAAAGSSAVAAPSLEQQIAKRSSFVQRYRDEFKKAIIGQEEMRDSLLIGLLVGGHILLEGVPGLAKTRAVNAVSAMLDLSSGRIQFTRDLMPAQITGQEELDRKSGKWVLRKGPIFTDILLADEINRAKAGTQSGMLQAMQERLVSIDGTTHRLSPLFLTIATQNPIEEDGVFPLPKAQFDRFMFMVVLDSPDAKALSNIAKLRVEERDAPLPPLDKVLTRDELLEARALVAQVEITGEVYDYIGRLVEATHKRSTINPQRDNIRQGASPRAAEWLALSAQAYAFMNGRHFVTPDDVQAVAKRVLRHRLILEFSAEGKTTPDQIIEHLLKVVPVIEKKK